MPPSTTLPSAATASAMPRPELVSRAGLALGGVLLLAGCGVGYAWPEERVLLFCTLGASMACFAAGLGRAWLQRPNASTGATATGPPTRLGAPGDKAMTASSARPLSASDPLPAAVPAPMALPAPAPSPDPTTAPLPPTTPIRPTAPGLGAAMAMRPVAVASAALDAGAAHPADPLDLTQLMSTPLSTLVLAALCVDPQRACQLFSQAAAANAAAHPDTTDVPLPRTGAAALPTAPTATPFAATGSA